MQFNAVVANNTHAVFSYKDGERHCMAAGHMKSITVLYTPITVPLNGYGQAVITASAGDFQAQCQVTVKV